MSGDIQVLPYIQYPIWGMAWLGTPMKDVVSCDKPMGGAYSRRSWDFLMGLPALLGDP